MRAIFIDSLAKTVTEVSFETGDDLRKLVGGYIEAAPVKLPPGDVLYVNEDGMRLGGGFYQFEGYLQPMVGQGVVVGPEWEHGTAFGNHDPKSTVRSVQAAVRFLTRTQVDSWGKANASEPAVTFTSFGHDGAATTTVASRFGSLIASIPRPEPVGCNWDDPSSRAAFIERVGPAAYNKAMEQHQAASVIETVNGHAIRPAGSRFGRLFMVGSTGSAFATLEAARRHALTTKVTP